MRIVKIPYDESMPLAEEELVLHLRDENDGVSERRGDMIPAHLQSRLKEAGVDLDSIVVDTTPLIRMTHPTADSSSDSPEALAGLYAYSISSTSQSCSHLPNIRATRLAMACGLHSQRFRGDVWVARLGYSPEQNGGYAMSNLELSLADIGAACRSPDMRGIVVDDMRETEEVASVPEWLGNATQKNYHDGASLSALANAMTSAGIQDTSDDDEEDISSSDGSTDSTSSVVEHKDGAKQHTATSLTEITLCLHCRGPANRLCDGCGGAYFCEEPRKCKMNGWSHQCICPTWKVYVERRNQLSSFPYLSGWQLPLLQEDCFSSENTYQQFLTKLGVIAPSEADPTTGDKACMQQNWWSTELHGWSGGSSLSAKDVNPFRRVSYQDGFALSNASWIPVERRITKDDIDLANAAYKKDANDSNVVLIQRDGNGLPILTSWEHYYRLRSLPPSSPIGLLATFPLTMYYALQQFGAVPLAVAQMLERPLRIHVVGIEKELNFVDLFKEMGFLLPENVIVDVTWIVREDMFPENRGERGLSLQLTTNLKLSIVSGTYGQSLDPDFDLGGTPDMILGMNAGLFAYESWRHVIAYLRHHKNVVGVFSDYNEHSGVNCASLGGWESTNSLDVNPFRQMRAMPVYCMNLPQLSNGFIYAFNEQELDE